jgi:ABC-type branched-subunit amino acid transport system ATPase component
MTAPLAIQGLSGGYGRLRVFNELSLDIAERRALGILGPNGVGKSTLLKTIAGILPGLDGDVLLQGTSVGQRSAYQRSRAGLVLVPEGRQILVKLSVRENLDLPRAARRLSEAAFRARLDEMLTLFPRLGERLDQPGGALSGGEQQMLAIARALLLDPVVLMLDEPTQGLAPILVSQVLSALQKLRGRFSMLVVEQNKIFLHALADEVLLMRGGRLSQSENTETNHGH